MMYLHAGWSRPKQSTRFPMLSAFGYDVHAYEVTVRVPRVIKYEEHYRLVVPGVRPTILYTSRDREHLDWVDFSIELVVGLVALVTGFKLGREAYEAFRPLINELYETDEQFRLLMQELGQRSLREDPLNVGKGVRDVWAHMWKHHRRAFLKAAARAVGRSLKPRALILMFLRWTLRLISAGASFLMELGLLVIPLNRKLRKPE